MPNVLQPSLANTANAKTVTESGAAPYATDLLQRGQAFTTAATPVYEGQLTTGPSQYQNQAWQGLANLTVPKNITEAGNQLGTSQPSNRIFLTTLPSSPQVHLGQQKPRST